MKNNSRISLFLIELILMLCVFITAAGIDAVLLAKAGTLSENSRRLNYAVELCSAAAECYKATGSGEAMGMVKSGDGWTLLYDRDFSPLTEGELVATQDTAENGENAPTQCAAENGEYALTLCPAEGGADIAFWSEGECIYSLSVKAADYEK